MEGLYILYIILGVNASIGLLLFEWAWAHCRPLREVDESRDSKYPAFRR